jgi:flagellum-specific peptidoglycan hydrolase FlgJ
LFFHLLAERENYMHTPQEEFLLKAEATARAAGHIWPEYAACEVALESGWGESSLTVKANNLFGQKQTHPPFHGTGTLMLPTKEFLHGAWVTINAEWMTFSDWQSCFQARMEMLTRLSKEYPGYARALAATDGGTFIREVSCVWSTGPKRGIQVLQIFNQHKLIFEKSTAQAA